MPLRVVALDLDGVIADTFDIHIEGWTAVLREQALPIPSSFDHLRGAERNVALRQLLLHAGLEPTENLLRQAVATKVAVRDKRIATLTPASILPGIPALLDECNALGLTLLCISTNSATHTILDRIGLRERFTEILAGQDLTPPKNASAARLLQALATRGCPARDALYIDDSAHACTQAVASGIPSVLVHLTTTVPGAYRRASLAGENVRNLYNEATTALGSPSFATENCLPET
jgi:beta-phosphoglucomutase